jgi:hypothetical protein
LDESIKFTPYIFIRGARDNIKICNVRFTPDTTVDTRTLQGLSGPGMNANVGFFPNEDNDPFSPPRGLIADGFEPHIPTPRGERLFQNISGNPGNLEQDSSITIGDELGGFLGVGPRNRSPLDTEELSFSSQPMDEQNELSIAYEDETLGGDADGANLVGATFRFERSPRFATRDFYLIESLNLNLDSYNSMVNFDTAQNVNKGDRRNILDTITDSNVGVGVVEYVPNELVYIDIKNSESVNLRNVSFRILDSDLNPVPVFGQSNMTCMIKD